VFSHGLFYFIENFFKIFYKVKNAPHGCKTSCGRLLCTDRSEAKTALARMEYVAYATALGARIASNTLFHTD